MFYAEMNQLLQFQVRIISIELEVEVSSSMHSDVRDFAVVYQVSLMDQLGVTHILIDQESYRSAMSTDCLDDFSPVGSVLFVRPIHKNRNTDHLRQSEK